MLLQTTAVPNMELFPTRPYTILLFDQNSQKYIVIPQ